MALFLGTFLFAACDNPPPAAAETRPDDSPADGCGHDGHLAVELYGGIRASIDWNPGELTCNGMPRPDDEGARVRMSGPIADGEEPRTLAFIFGLPDLEEGKTARELPTNVTLIEEGTGRFFGTTDTNGCWTDVTRQESAVEGEPLYRIEGTLYCVSPLAELNGTTSVTFTELKFTGRLSWEQPE